MQRRRYVALAGVALFAGCSGDSDGDAAAPGPTTPSDDGGEETSTPISTTTRTPTRTQTPTPEPADLELISVRPPDDPEAGGDLPIDVTFDLPVHDHTYAAIVSGELTLADGETLAQRELVEGMSEERVEQLTATLTFETTETDDGRATLDVVVEDDVESGETVGPISVEILLADPNAEE